MAIMLVGSMSALAGRLWPFSMAVPAGWFAARAARPFAGGRSRAVGHDVGQVVLCAALVYLITAAGSVSAMSDMSLPVASEWAPTVVARVLAVALLVGCLAVTAGQARSMRLRPTTSARVASAGCHMAIGPTTVYMLAAAV